MPNITMVDKKFFSEKIRFYRNKAGLTQSELAERLHVSFQAISSWECANTLPDLDNLYELASVLGVAVDTLLRSQSDADEELFIGIDGGGSSTEFALFTTKGHILKCFKLTGSNSSTIGLSNALAVLRRGIDSCIASVDAAVKGIFIGCAGGLLDEVGKSLSESYPNIPIRIDSDGVNALMSDDGDAAMICGTGTVFLRHDGDGKYRKFGGWGYRWGDFGSAYNFGREGLCMARAYEDGVDSSPLIYSLMKESLAAQSLTTTLRTFTEVAEIAKRARFVFEAYKQNDPYAEQIIRNEMQRLAWIVKSVCPNGGRVIACGGINQHFGDITLPILKEYIPENIELVLPKLPPVYGACREACRRFDAIPDEKFFENFSSDYRETSL